MAPALPPFFPLVPAERLRLEDEEADFFALEVEVLLELRPLALRLVAFFPAELLAPELRPAALLLRLPDDEAFEVEPLLALEPAEELDPLALAARPRKAFGSSSSSASKFTERSAIAVSFSSVLLSSFKVC